MSARGGLPVGIIRPARGDDYSWELVHDYAIFLNRQHAYGKEPKWEGRFIRVDEPLAMVAGSSVPPAERDRITAEAEDRKRERREQVEKLADEFVRGERNHHDLRTDFQLEREVMDELWRRFREVTGDRFLLNAVKATQPTDPEGGEG